MLSGQVASNEEPFLSFKPANRFEPALVGVEDSRRGVKGVGGFCTHTVLFLRMLEDEGDLDDVNPASKNMDRNTLHEVRVKE